MFEMSNENQLGFTMIELLISMAIGVAIIATLTNTFVTQRQSYDVQQQITGAVQTARAAMDMMSREIRLAGYDPLNSGFNGITYDVDQLQIKADLDGSGSPTQSNEDITYKHDSSAVRVTRDTGGGAQPFAENAQEFTFAYLDADGAATTLSANIRQVRISLTIRTEEADAKYGENGGYRVIKLTSYITPRNLGF